MGQSSSDSSLLSDAETALFQFGLGYYSKTIEPNTNDIKFKTSNFILKKTGPGHLHQCEFTTSAKPSSMKKVVPLVLLHGFGSAGGIFSMCLPFIRRFYHNGPVFAIDMYGCGLSSRPKISNIETEVTEGFLIFTEPRH